MSEPSGRRALNALLGRLDGVRRTSRGFSARCPGHADAKASLAVSVGRHHRVLLHCFAGCSTPAILSALNLTWRDLFSDNRPSASRRPAPVCELDAVRGDLVAHERRLAERRGRFRELMEMAAEACENDRIVSRARGLVTDDESGWSLEDQATALERETWARESEIHEALVGRVLW